MWLVAHLVEVLVGWKGMVLAVVMVELLVVVTAEVWGMLLAEQSGMMWGGKLAHLLARLLELKLLDTGLAELLAEQKAG